MHRATSDRPLPVLYIARGGAVDGSGRQLLYLLKWLDRTRYEPIVLLDEGGALAEEATALGVTVRVAPMRPWRSLRGWPWRRLDANRLVRIAAGHDVGLVHCSDTWRTPYAAFVAQKIGVPLVGHVRGPTRPRDLQKNRCLDAHTLIGIAERYRSEIHAAGHPVDRTCIIDDAVDCEAYRPDASLRDQVRGEWNVDDTPVVGMVGRVERAKRVLEFVEVVARLPKSIAAKFVIIGSTRRGDYVDEVRAAIERSGLQDRVQLVGRREDMPAVLNALDLLVTLSGGSVMFEAMACGVPVLSVRPDGRHSQHTMHDRTAWCVTTEAPEPAADALKKLLTDTALRKRLGEAGMRCVRERLAPELLAEKTHAIYERVLAESLRSAAR